MAQSDAAQVLVLEDDANMRELIQDLMADEGYQVVSASRGEEAIELATQSRLDLIVFDIRMEGMDGLQALARIQEGGGWDIPSLAITGFAGDDDPIRALRMGVGAYLRKPFQPEQLLEAAAQLIEAHRRKLLDQQSTQSLREVLRWGLNQLSGKPGPSATAQLFARLSSELAETVGLPPNIATSLELATLVLTVAPEARSQADCPTVVRSWSDYLEERYDGQGPRQLQGNEIPLETRLVAVAHGGSTLQEGETPDLLVPSTTTVSYSYKVTKKKNGKKKTQTITSSRPMAVAGQNLFGDLSLEGLVYVWGDVTAYAGNPKTKAGAVDSYNDNPGKISLSGAMIAYGGNPENGQPGEGSNGSRGRVDMYGKQISLTYDSAKLLRSLAPGGELKPGPVNLKKQYYGLR